MILDSSGGIPGILQKYFSCFRAAFVLWMVKFLPPFGGRTILICNRFFWSLEVLDMSNFCCVGVFAGTV